MPCRRVCYASLNRPDAMPNEYPSEAHVDRHIKLMQPGGEILVGPGSLAVNEQLRAEALAGSCYRGSRIATDDVGMGAAKHRILQ